MRIVDKNIADLKLKLTPKNIILKVHNNAKKWLAEKGYNQKQGARPMERLIQERNQRQTIRRNSIWRA